MDKIEQILFSIALAAFGWLLFVGNKGVHNPLGFLSSSSGGSTGANFASSNVPYFLSYNVAAGFTGTASTAETDAGVALPQMAYNPNGGATAAPMFPFAGMTAGFST